MQFLRNPILTLRLLPILCNLLHRLSPSLNGRLPPLTPSRAKLEVLSNFRQLLVRRELDLSVKELQEQVRSDDASATEYLELGAVMLRRKFYPAAMKYLQQAIETWDGDDEDLALAFMRPYSLNQLSFLLFFYETL